MTCVPALMMTCLMCAFMSMIRKSKKEFKALHKRLQVSKNLHFLLASRAETVPNQDIPQFTPFRTLGGRRKEFNILNINNDDAATDHNTLKLPIPVINIKKFENSDNRNLANSKHQIPVIEDAKHSNDNSVFFIHDEVKGTKNEKLSVQSAKFPRRNKTDNSAIIPVISYTQDIELVLNDEIISMDFPEARDKRMAFMSTTDRSSSTESYSRSSATESVRTSISDSFNLSSVTESIRSTLMRSLRPDQTSFDDNSFCSYKTEVNGDDFVEVSLC